MLATVILGGLVLLPGVPLALVLFGGDGDDIQAGRRWSGVLVEGLLVGLCWWLLLGLWFSHAGWYAWWQLLAPTVVVTAVAAFRARRRLPPRPRLTALGGFVAVLAALTVVLRAEPFYFLFQIGDFGEYVNRANAVADGGGFIGWFTQGFTVALSMTHLALGEASTVDLMPFLGLVLLAVTVELARRLGATTMAQATVAVIMAVGAVPVWFGRFPASETLYAVLQVGLVLLVVTAVQRGSTRTATVAGVVCGLLLVTRGNGILLGPIVVLTVLLAALVGSRRTVDVLCRFTWSAMLSLGAAFVFNARFSYPYFIAEQLPKFVPEPLFRHLEGMGGLRFATPRLLLLVAGTAALVWLLRRLPGRLSPATTAAVLAAIVVAAVVVIVAVFDHRGIVDALGRYDVVVEVLGAVGLAAALWRFRDRMDDAQRVGVIMVVLVCGAFAVLYAERLPTPRYAPYHLYWDRYLFSELFPLMVLATIWAVGELRRIPVPVLGAGVLGLGAWLHAQGATARENVFMDEAYEQLQVVDELAADDDLGIIFVGVLPQDMPPALYHPNTHRIVASPLASTFNRYFLNLGLHPYAPDPQPDEVDVDALLEAKGVDEAYLVQVAVGADAPASLGGDVLGSTLLRIPLLDRPLEGEAEWTFPTFAIVVSKVEA